MEKEILSLPNIKQDFKVVLGMQCAHITEWRLSYIIPITIVSVILGTFFKNLWIALAIFSVAAYHIVRYVMQYREYLAKKKAVKNAVNRADICISIEKFDHIAMETIYAPHYGRRWTYMTKLVEFYYFASGRKWRLPLVLRHYKWSKTYDISCQGLENISIQGDEFMYIFLQKYPDVVYVYPCKNFVLDKALT